MNLIIIVAVSKNNVIGYEGKIPWKIPEDMHRFKFLTIGHPVIMGRKTYESIPERFRPLFGRKNIVLSRRFKSNEGISIARSLDEAITLTDGIDTFIAGGQKVYEEFLPLSNRIELTRVNAEYSGDSFFPEADWGRWRLVNNEKFVNYSFESYIRMD